MTMESRIRIIMQVKMGVYLIFTIPQYGITIPYTRRQVFLKIRQASRDPMKIRGGCSTGFLVRAEKMKVDESLMEIFTGAATAPLADYFNRGWVRIASIMPSAACHLLQ
jgi:hypothetical protein